MRDRNKQRVMCTTCGWSGGRAAGSLALDAPCSKCGGATEPIGPVYVEERVLAGCPSCSWWGEVAPARLGGPCRRCDKPIEAVLVVTKDHGLILA